MQGFSEEFRDIKDFILKITYQIWEEKGINKIRDWYGKNAPVYTPVSISRDVENVVSSTLATLHMFPDRILLGEEVIAKEYDDGVFYSSHRILSTMTHMGEGTFGRPSFKPVKTRTIADCVCKDEVIIEEWMVRDQSAIVKDIGLCPEEFGRALGKSMLEHKTLLDAQEYVNIWKGGPVSKEPQNISKEIASGMEDILVHGNINRVFTLHDRAAYSYMPQSVHLNGTDEIAKYFTSLSVCFSEASFEVHHYIEEANEPNQIALRWTLSGKHSGFGLYKSPCGEPITIMAMSHFEIRNGKIYRAFHIFDELSIWAQIAAHEIKKQMK